MDRQRRFPRREGLVHVSGSVGAAPLRAAQDQRRGVVPVRRVVVAMALGAIAGARLAAQDTRTVTEPRIPAACTVVTAELSPVADTTLAESDELKTDTKRIQAAI